MWVHSKKVNFTTLLKYIKHADDMDAYTYRLPQIVLIVFICSGFLTDIIL